MSLKSEIVKLLQDEGYRINEAVDDAIDEFLTVVEEETEGVEDDMEEHSYNDDD